MKMVKERVRCGKCRCKVLPIGQAVWAVPSGVRPVAGDVVGHQLGGEDAEICHHHIVQTVGGERYLLPVTMVWWKEHRAYFKPKQDDKGGRAI